MKDISRLLKTTMAKAAKFSKSFMRELMGFIKYIIEQVMFFLKSITTKAIPIAALCIVLVAAVFAFRYPNGQSAKSNFTSQLIEALDIDELSTSKLIYNGIAEVYHEDGQTKIYSVLYNSTVKVGVQVDDIKFDVDADKKIMKVILPAISVQTPIVDASSLSFIPYDSNTDIKTAITACREDARQKAEQSEKLIQTAEENLKSIIEALALPLLKDEGYTIVW